MSLHTTIEKYSHFFVVKNPTKNIYPIIYQLSSKYTQFGMKFDPYTKKQKWGPLKTFAIYVERGSEFRFHIGQYQEFMDALLNRYIDKNSYSVIEHPVQTPEKIDIKLKDGWELRDYQQEAHDFIVEETEGNFNSPLVMIQTGGGKLQPLDSPVKVPDGWKKIGELNVGDYVTAWDGTPSQVIGVYPHSSVPIYRITFEDGRSTLCGLDHLWRVTTSQKAAWTKVIKTVEIARLLNLNTYKDRLYIDLPFSENNKEKDYLIDPYLLGVLLGDGGFSKSRVIISKQDEELFENIKLYLPEGHSFKRLDSISRSIVLDNNIKRNNIKASLIHYGLMGKRSFEKFIPKEYLNGSHKQRLALVQGLLDTDGTVCKDKGTIAFSSSSKQLALDFQYLIRSLGGYAKMTSRITFYTYKGEKKEGKRSYSVFVRYRKPSELFRLSRKKIRTKDDGQYVANLKLRIKSIEFSHHSDARCIAIDHPDHLYITDDFIVTHNTVTALAAAATLKYRFAVVVLASYVDKWIGDISEILKIDKNEIAVIRGSDALQRCTRYPESDLPTPKAFVISISTIANWYKFYEEQRDHPSLEAYSCKPWEFFSHLGIGTVIFDEVHQHPHAVYRIYTYLHAPRTISLSATLLTKDPTLQKVQAMMFPHHRRYDKLKLKRYITVHACAYQISNFINSHIRTSEYGQNSYSQTAFEKSILKHRNLSKQYLDMIADLVQSSYIEGKMEGDKLAIFVGSAKMADAVVGILKKRFNGLDIRTYLERDPYENAIVPDVRVSTILSLGTAVDIPQLRVSIMTNSIESPIANVQTLGRLRELKDRDVRFYYLYCSTIPKHQEYHLKKIDLFSSRVKEHKQLFLRTLYP